MEEAGSYETSVPTCQTTARCRNQQYCSMLPRNPSTDSRSYHAKKFMASPSRAHFKSLASKRPKQETASQFTCTDQAFAVIYC